MDAFIADFRQYGVFGITVFLLGVALWRFGQAIYKRLFDDKTGYVTILINELIQFFHKTSENQDKQTAILSEMQIQNKNVDDRLAKIEVESKRIIEAQIKSINILDKIACSKNGSLPK